MQLNTTHKHHTIGPNEIKCSMQRVDKIIKMEEKIMHDVDGVLIDRR